MSDGPAEVRQVVNSWTYWQNAAGVWVPVTAANPLPVDTPTGLLFKCVAVEVPAEEVYYVSSGEVWGVLALVVEGELRIDGEVHAWGDVTGGGTITGEGELRLH